MISEVNYHAHIKKINPFAIIRVLTKMGWKNIPRKNQQIRLMQKKVDANLHQVIVPMDRQLADYKEALITVIENVAKAEGKTADKVICFFLNPNADILRIRLVNNSIENGSILLDDAIRLYDNAKKLLSAAASDIINPKKNHMGKVEDKVQDFLARCRFGQTEIGSYISTVVCPFSNFNNDNYEQVQLFSDEEVIKEAFSRKVINRIMTNLETIKKRIDDNESERLIAYEETQISANFFEAINGIGIDSTAGNQVDFGVLWSPGIPGDHNIPNNIVLSSDYSEPIKSVVSSLKSKAKTTTTILGKVKKMEAAQNVDERESGKITVVYLDAAKNKAKTVMATLNKFDYAKAVQAHLDNQYVELQGELNERTRTIEQPMFSVLDV